MAPLPNPNGLDGSLDEEIIVNTKLTNNNDELIEQLQERICHLEKENKKLNEKIHNNEIEKKNKSTREEILESIKNMGEGKLNIKSRSHVRASWYGSPSEPLLESKRSAKRLSSGPEILKYRCETSIVPQTASEILLLECCLLIELSIEKNNGVISQVPHVKAKYPPEVIPPNDVGSFCFPDANTWGLPDEKSMNARTHTEPYTIYLTDEKGGRKFGYCRRVLPEGSHNCLPLAYCIITAHRATGFYYKVLQEIESKHGYSQLDNVIDWLFHQEFPSSKRSLKLDKIFKEFVNYSNFKRLRYLSFSIERPLAGYQLENRDITQLFHVLDIKIVLSLFDSLLQEKKMLFFGNSVSTLSCCINALDSILYPFSWQQICVTVLPTKLIKFCDCPLPYIFGVLKNSASSNDFLFSEFKGVIVDIEEKSVKDTTGDTTKIIPEKLENKLRSALKKATRRGNTKSLTHSERNDLIFEAFLCFFVVVCGHYRKHVFEPSKESVEFQKELFIKEAQQWQNFLERFTETGMFQEFIKNRVENNEHDLFSEYTILFGNGGINGSKTDANRKATNLSNKIKSLFSF